MSSYKVILSIIAFVVVLEYGSALKCHYCVPDEDSGDLCDADSQDYGVCDGEAAEEWINSMPNSLRNTFLAKGNSWEPRCIKVKLSNGEETAYVRGCMYEVDVLCDLFEQQAGWQGIESECSFCGTDGCNGGNGLASFVKFFSRNRA